jgi:hypothetical protein
MLKQRCRKPERHVAVVSTFCMVAPNTMAFVYNVIKRTNYFVVINGEDQLDRSCEK